MFRNVLTRLTTETRSVPRCVQHAHPLRPAACVSVSSRTVSDVKDQQFDTSLLDFLVCPLSKKPLRYEVKTNELINEELCIAYPIIDGIPNMIPQDARLIQKDTDPSQG